MIFINHKPLVTGDIIKPLWLLIIGVLFAPELVSGWKKPCEFEDSINITSGNKDSQGNYHHKGVIYKSDQYDTFDFEIVNTTILKTKEHVRGCICKVRGNCIPLCCDPETDPACKWDQPLNGTVVDVNTWTAAFSEDLSQQFGFLFGDPYCTKYSLEPHYEPNDNFTILSVRNFSWK